MTLGYGECQWIGVRFDAQTVSLTGAKTQNSRA